MVRSLTVGYLGTNYAGWQRQPNAVSVQQRLEEALGEFLGGRTRLVAAGRTDAGVHARGQVVHLEAAPATSSDLPDAAFVHGTNQHLPADIRVLGAKRMPDGFHARKSSSSKIYDYRVIRGDVLSPLDALFAIRVAPEAEVQRMRLAAARLEGEHDFSAFALSGGAHTDPHRRLFRAELQERGPEIYFRFQGAGFLRGMVRSMVGSLLEVGLGRQEPNWIDSLLRGASRSQAGPTAPARGLTLVRVLYPGYTTE